MAFISTNDSHNPNGRKVMIIKSKYLAQLREYLLILFVFHDAGLTCSVMVFLTQVCGGLRRWRVHYIHSYGPQEQELWLRPGVCLVLRLLHVRHQRVQQHGENIEKLQGNQVIQARLRGRRWDINYKYLYKPDFEAEGERLITNIYISQTSGPKVRD